MNTHNGYFSGTNEQPPLYIITHFPSEAKAVVIYLFSKFPGDIITNHSLLDPL